MRYNLKSGHLEPSDQHLSIVPDITLENITCASVMLHIIAVFAFPPKAGCKMRVSLLSLYGTCPLHYILHLFTLQSEYGETALNIWYRQNLPLTLSAFTQLFNDSSQCHEAFIDVRALFEPDTFCTCFGSTFWTSKVHQILEPKEKSKQKKTTSLWIANTTKNNIWSKNKSK